MRAAYECFQSGAGTQAILAAAGSDGDGHGGFYARLYVALYNEAEGREEEARAAMEAAVRTAYARQSGDYMAALAKVHCQRRGWEVPRA
jgi:L-cysteine desulfidase